MKLYIKELREQKGISQVKLAEMAEISRATLSNLETGKADNTTAGTLQKIATALDCSVSDIFLSE